MESSFLDESLETRDATVTFRENGIDPTGHLLFVPHESLGNHYEPAVDIYERAKGFQIALAVGIPLNDDVGDMIIVRERRQYYSDKRCEDPNSYYGQHPELCISSDQWTDLQLEQYLASLAAVQRFYQGEFGDLENEPLPLMVAQENIPSFPIPSE